MFHFLHIFSKTLSRILFLLFLFLKLAEEEDCEDYFIHFPSTDPVFLSLYLTLCNSSFSYVYDVFCSSVLVFIFVHHYCYFYHYELISCMRKDGYSSHLSIDPEIEKTCKRNRKNKQRRVEEAIMAEGGERPLLDYAILTTNGYRSAIVYPTIEGNKSFEIKTGMINMIQQNQFSGAPNEHIANYNELCGTFQIHHIDAEAIRFRLFSFSLRDRAKQRLHTLPADSITT